MRALRSRYSQVVPPCAGPIPITSGSLRRIIPIFVKKVSKKYQQLSSRADNSTRRVEEQTGALALDGAEGDAIAGLPGLRFSTSARQTGRARCCASGFPVPAHNANLCRLIQAVRIRVPR
jgi:hypothetical protein